MIKEYDIKKVSENRLVVNAKFSNVSLVDFEIYESSAEEILLNKQYPLEICGGLIKIVSTTEA